MDAEKFPVEMIPVTDKLKGQIRALNEAIFDAIDACRVDGEIASGIDGALRSIVGSVGPEKMGAKDAIETIFLSLSLNGVINDIISGLEVILKEIRGNKVLYENRHVIVSAMKDAIEKDDRSIILLGGESFPSESFDISAYTGNVQFIREYKKMIKKLKKGVKQHGR